jgi:cytochrome P450
VGLRPTTFPKGLHVPQTVQWDYDHYDPDFAFDPHERYRELREQCPVAYTENYGGFHVVAKYEDVDFVLHHPEIFSSWPADTPPTPGHSNPLIPFEVDPPDHGHYRRIVAPLFAPKQMKAREPMIRAFARTLVDRMLEQQEFDFVRVFAAPFPSSVFLSLVGLDVHEEQRDWLYQVADQVLHTTGADPTDDQSRAGVRRAAGRELNDFLTGLYQERVSEPGEDLISRLISATFGDDRPMTKSEILNFAYILVLGGLDTVSTALAFSFLHMGRRFDLQDRLVAEPSLIPSAVEEMLRAESAIHPSRTVIQPVCLRGVDLVPGDRIVLPFASVDRDADAFDRPDEILIDRNPNRHFAFGGGIHRCLGSHLARIEMQVAFEEILDRIPRFHVPSDAKIRAHGGQTRSLVNLPFVVGRR